MLIKNAHFNGERSQLVTLAGYRREQYLEWLRRKIVLEDRIDILASKVLGYDLAPVHNALLRTQILYPFNNLQLVGRGYGKSTMCTVTKAIHYLVKYPRVRIIIASKTVKQSQARLKEISAHLESNELLIELFGEFYNRNNWNARELEIAQRFKKAGLHTPWGDIGVKSSDATPSIACCGAKGSVAGAHFDVEFSDDLIDKTNSFTDVTREEVNEWYNATFTPMLDPRDPDIPFRRHRHRVGTRYHALDQYGRWIKKAKVEYENGVPQDKRMFINVIPAYDYKDTRGNELIGHGLGVYLGTGSGKSPWPGRFSAEQLSDTKRQIGRLAFEAQYLNDIDSQNGEIFSVDQFIEAPLTEIKSLFPGMRFYLGVDLAISEKHTADDTAIVVVGKLGSGDDAKYYVVDTFNQKGVRFSQQTAQIKRLHDKWDSVGSGVKRIGIETVAYQAAQYQQLQDSHPELRSKLKKITPRKGTDKVSRAWNRSGLMESGRVFLPTVMRKINGEVQSYTPAWELREQMVLLPNGKHDDLWDAFDHAITSSESRGRTRRREKEVGLF